MGMEMPDAIGTIDSNVGGTLIIAKACVMLDVGATEPDVAACTDIFGEVDHPCNGGTS